MTVAAESRRLPSRARPPSDSRAGGEPHRRPCPSQRFIDDCETPVSAYLKLRGDGPSFLLESAEQGQRFGRWSFLGSRARTVIRIDDGVLRWMARRSRVRRSLRRSSTRGRAPSDGAEMPGLPPFAGGAVGLFCYDLARYAEPSIGPANPDQVGVPDLARDGPGGAARFRPPPPRGHDRGLGLRRRGRGRRRPRTLRRSPRSPRCASAWPRRFRRPRPGSVRSRLRSSSNLGSRATPSAVESRQGVHPGGRRVPDRTEPALER